MASDGWMENGRPGGSEKLLEAGAEGQTEQHKYKADVVTTCLIVVVPVIFYH